ncbi:peptidase T [candidate division KSB1 bacterium]|nr:peptidase T [candidate division KSB1 bacterium]
MGKINHTCLERFLRYVTYDTQSSEDSTSFPSTEKQKKLAQALVEELLEIGLKDAAMDEWGYVTATLPATVEHKVPVIGLIAHMDTSPDVSGENVKAVIHKNYAGGDIALSSGVVIKVDENPALKEQIGHDLITSDGTTLLGADNKAGIAEIFDALHHLVAHPEIPHGTIRVAVTPDEEVGRGTEHFDIKAFAADFAYTIDGESLGEVEDETFCADTVVIQITGVNVHPGYARGKLVNSVKLAADFIDQLPKDGLSPETTEKREGYVHPHIINGNVETTTIKILVRDFTLQGLHEKEAYLEEILAKLLSKHPRARADFKIEESYRNMKFELDKKPRVVEYAIDAVARAGITPKKNIIRGGTDGAKLSYQGLLTPNIFTGGHNFHSRQEWISIQDMQKAVQVIVNLVQIWSEKYKQ